MSPIADDYNDVPGRIREFKAKYPEGSFQPADPKNPFQIITVGQQVYLAYTAAAYRSPEDPRPGIGSAWETVPGKTNFTRDSELQNAETSAWGRAIVAALAADAKKVATSEDVQVSDARRRERQDNLDLRKQIANVAKSAGWDITALTGEFESNYGMTTAQASADDLRDFLDLIMHRRPDEKPGQNVPEAEPEGEAGKAQGTPPEGVSPPPPPSGGQPTHEFYAGSPGGPCRECEGPKDAPWHVEPDAEWFRDALLRETSRDSIKALYRRSLMRGFGDTEVGDETGQAIKLEDLAQRRMKETA